MCKKKGGMEPEPNKSRFGTVITDILSDVNNKMTFYGRLTSRRFAVTRSIKTKMTFGLMSGKEEYNENDEANYVSSGHCRT
jgi:hypothetical protein